jgi:site-specific DNA-cytosine methylase
MLILDLCGGSGAWSAPYREAGYCVEVVDPAANGRDVRLWQVVKARVHGILAAPPCTVFSYARNRYEPSEAEYTEALSVVDACCRIVLAQKPAWWALENPRNKLRRYLGPARLEFYHWEYGDAAHKPTCIWGEFVAPMKQPKPRTKPSTFNTKQENASPGDAITPSGFARAFYNVNP